MIDIHCHILPEMDDGAENPEISLSMGISAEENNIKKIVATPHYFCTAEENFFIEKRDRRIDFLKKLFEEKGVGVELLPGAEVYLNENIFFDNTLEKLTLNNTKYLLTELDFTGVSVKKILRYFDEVVSRGLTPVLAHPERYRYFQRDYGLVNYLADMGTLFQINATSLAGLDGEESLRLSYEMVKNNMAAFLACDAHGVEERHNNMMIYFRHFPEGIDRETLNRIVNINPEKLLDNKDIAPQFRHIKKHA